MKKAGYDWLACVVGEDWGDALGCTYYIKSTSDYSMVSVKVTTTDRENPMLHSVYDVWEIARLEEREVYDFYGINSSTTLTCAACICAMTGWVSL